MDNSTYYEDEIAKLVAQHGAVPPPWFMFQGAHPCSICWRMGAGESYIIIFFTWWKEQKESLDESQRIDYFRKWPPPLPWLTWMIEVIWDLDPEDFDDDDDYWPYFRRTKALGFGGENDYKSQERMGRDERRGRVTNAGDSALKRLNGVKGFTNRGSGRG